MLSASFNFKTRVSSITGSLFPSWIMLLNASAGFADVLTARKTALYRRRLVDESQQTTIVLPREVSARFIRVQLESNDFLTVAEIEAFTERTSLVTVYMLSAYRGIVD